VTQQRERGGAPTLEVVAARAGVSRATASRVLNGSTKVSPQAHDAVVRAAEELHYLPNLAARSLVTRRTGSFAFVVTEPDDRLFSDPFFALLLRGAQRELARRDLQLVLAYASTDPDRQRIERFATARHVDGVVLISLHGADPLPAALERAGVPVVIAGRPLGPDEGLSYVDVDNRGAARAATELLIGRGCRTVAMVAGPQDMVAGRDRLAGYRDALMAAGRPLDETLVARGDFTRLGGTRAMRELLERSPRLDGVFAASDTMALSALSVLHAAGRRVPADVALVGFDDVPDAAAADPPLTTVRQPIDEMGRRIAELLVQRLDGPPGLLRLVLPAELVRRASA
jgi:DNA-binding LacI/PurR family transcriptional regulator